MSGALAEAQPPCADAGAVTDNASAPSSRPLAWSGMLALATLCCNGPSSLLPSFFGKLFNIWSEAIYTDMECVALQVEGEAQRDVLHAVSCAAGYNLRWLLRAIARWW